MKNYYSFFNTGRKPERTDDKSNSEIIIEECSVCLSYQSFNQHCN